MNSDKSDEDDHEAISKQILEYYKKYSLSQQLPKYFSGTSLSYMPQIVKDGDIVTDSDTREPGEPIPELKPVSPASSVASNRKLEWDNGADIGYANCSKSPKLHKSLSLPTVINSVVVEPPIKPKLKSQIAAAISYSSFENNKRVYSSSSSSSYPVEAPVESLSSSLQTHPKLTTSSSSCVSYVKNKIGSPNAESTPKMNYVETPIAPKKNLPRKVVSLCVTKPIVVDCPGVKAKLSKDKLIQTSVVEGSSKCVQTGDSLLSDPPVETLSDHPIENQTVIVLKYNTDTDSDVGASHCDSFDYYDAKSKKVKSVVSSDSSKEIPVLGQLIASKQSNSLKEDVDQSIVLLQKLLKSKKYDVITKKRYIKKIVQKIVDNKYTEDSTTSSELFVPKKQQNLQENIPWCPNLSVNSFNNEYLSCSSKRAKKSIYSISQPQDSPLTSTSLEQQYTSGSWKEDKTVSERLLEDKQRGQGDQLVSFARKERQHQLAWIKDEISHLTKLRGLLEQHKTCKTTTVYMVSEKSKKSLPARQYVIETELSESSSAEVHSYNLHHQGVKTNYRVNETGKGEHKGTEVIGEIEVVSGENTTNIKVKTRKVDEGEDFKPKQPTLVGPGKYDTFPRSRAEAGRCKSAVTHRIGGSVDAETPLQKAPSMINIGSLSAKLNEIITKYTASGTSNVEATACCQCRRAFADVDNFENKTASKTTRLCSCAKDTSKSRKIAGKYRSEAFSKIVCNCEKNLKRIGDIIGKYTEERSVNTLSLPPQSLCDKTKKNQSSEKYRQHLTSCRCTETQTVNTEGSSGSEGTKEHRQATCCKRAETQTSPPIETVVSVNTEQSYASTKRRCLCLKGEESQQHETCRCTETQTERQQLTEESQGARFQCLCYKRETIDKGTQQVTCCECAENQTCPTEGEAFIDAKRQLQVDAECQCSSSKATQSYENHDSSEETFFDSATSASSSTTTTSTSIRSCVCCKRKNVAEKNLYTLREKLSDRKYALCHPCYRQRNVTLNAYTNPAHVCNCYTYVETETLQKIKNTINELNELEQYCTCANSSGRQSNYCQHCKCKLKKTSKNKNGIAYVLTFEDQSLVDTEKKRKKRHLEEIKIKIPVTYKKRKDKENKRKKKTYDGESTSATESGKRAVCSVQEYLRKNRPGFVEDAEERRKTVVDSQMQRERAADQNKLQFLQKFAEVKSCDKSAKRLFSSKEMQEITRRNYRKLPEVQRKLHSNRERQLRQASRLMADTFNKKLRDNVLKGKMTLPTDVKVVEI